MISANVILQITGEGCKNPLKKKKKLCNSALIHVFKKCTISYRVGMPNQSCKRGDKSSCKILRNDPKKYNEGILPQLGSYTTKIMQYRNKCNLHKENSINTSIILWIVSNLSILSPYNFTSLCHKT